MMCSIHLFVSLIISDTSISQVAAAPQFSSPYIVDGAMPPTSRVPAASNNDFQDVRLAV
jgi:hypothetical protein